MLGGVQEAELISGVTLLLHPMIRIIIIPHPNSAEREDALPMEDDLWRRTLGSSPHLEARAPLPLGERMQQ